MEIFEEITRYKLIKGIFRLENVYSSKELDALAAAYLAWMSVNRPERIVVQRVSLSCQLKNKTFPQMEICKGRRVRQCPIGFIAICCLDDGRNSEF